MKQKVSRAYFHITDKLADTPISQIPGIKNLHRGMLKVLNWASDSPESHRWITYDGHHLYINPDDHVSEILYQTGRYEPQVRDEINEILENGDIAIDVGGHLGHHSITMRRCVGENGQVMIFEPHPKNANNIRKTIDKNNWNNIEVYEKALSNEEGKTILEENPTNTGASTIKSEIKSGETYEVEVMLLSEYLSKKTQIIYH